MTVLDQVLRLEENLPGKCLSTRKSLEKNHTQLSKLPLTPPVQDNHNPQSHELQRHKISPFPSFSNSNQFGVANATIVATVVTNTHINAKIVKQEAITCVDESENNKNVRET